MATYKVLQDIEAEDKLFGPFTLKQFIFGAITIVIGFVGFRIALTGVSILVKMPIILTLLPFFILFGFLAAPIGRDQTTEIWLLARLRFLFKPRLRIWSQDGLSDLVTITVPKKIEKVYTNNFTQDEVRSRLKALANTVDSRGWAVKNVNANMFNQPDYLDSNANSSDRLIDPSSMPQDVPAIDVLASDDILDPANNVTAQHMDALIQQSSAHHKQEVAAKMNPRATNQSNQQPADYWFMHQSQMPKASLPSDYSTFGDQQVVSPGTSTTQSLVTATDEEEAFAHKVAEENKKARSFLTDHGKVLQPLHDAEGNIIPKSSHSTESGLNNDTSTTRQEPLNPAIIELARNDDFTVATIARQAKKANSPKKPDNGEVVISLH